MFGNPIKKIQKLWGKLSPRDQQNLLEGTKAWQRQAKEVATLKAQIEALRGPLHNVQFENNGRTFVYLHATGNEGFDVEIDGWRYWIDDPWYLQMTWHRPDGPAIEHPRRMPN